MSHLIAKDLRDGSRVYISIRDDFKINNSSRINWSWSAFEYATHFSDLAAIEAFKKRILEELGTSAFLMWSEVVDSDEALCMEVMNQ